MSNRPAPLLTTPSVVVGAVVGASNAEVMMDATVIGPAAAWGVGVTWVVAAPVDKSKVGRPIAAGPRPVCGAVVSRAAGQICASPVGAVVHCIPATLANRRTHTALHILSNACLVAPPHGLTITSRHDLASSNGARQMERPGSSSLAADGALACPFPLRRGHRSLVACRPPGSVEGGPSEV